MKIYKQFIITFILFSATLLVEQYTSLDTTVQNLFFNFANCSWLINRQDNYILHFFLYSGVKVAIIAASVIVLLAFLASYGRAKLRPYRYSFVVFLAAMAIVPLVLAGAKKYTNVYCPAQLVTYCGNKPYAKLFESYPQDFDRQANSRGRCFPAGHASGGFALMVLFFCFKKRKNKLLGLSLGLGLGWAMGLYQMLRGEHFLSHTLTSMFGAWLLILLIVWTMDRIKKKYPRFLEGKRLFQFHAERR